MGMKVTMIVSFKHPSGFDCVTIGPFFFFGNRTSGYFRIFGYGLWWKDRSKNRLYFSERNWIKPFHFAIGTYHFKFLGRE